MFLSALIGLRARPASATGPLPAGTGARPKFPRLASELGEISSACRARSCGACVEDHLGPPTGHRRQTSCGHALPNGGGRRPHSRECSAATSSRARAQRGGAGEHAKLLEIHPVVRRQHRLCRLVVDDADDDFRPASPGDMRDRRLFLGRVSRRVSEGRVRHTLALQHLGNNRDHSHRSPPSASIAA